jgi:hypothetical protein
VHLAACQPDHGQPALTASGVWIEIAAFNDHGIDLDSCGVARMASQIAKLEGQKKPSIAPSASERVRDCSKGEKTGEYPGDFFGRSLVDAF